MKIRTSIACAVIATASGLAVAQTPAYTFEMRLIPDGATGSPSGSWSMYPLTSADPTAGPSRIGFWLQARVSQTGGQNWGIARAVGGITVSGTGPVFAISAGTINASGTQMGRGTGYRLGGTPNDIGGFDAYVGPSRNDQDFDGDLEADDNGDGLSENPWGVNGSTHPTNVDGVPIDDGVFSPWANVYRVWLDTFNASPSGNITITAQISLQGAVLTNPTSIGSESWVLQLGQGQNLTASYNLRWPIPAPGAAAALGLGMLTAVARRRR